MTWLAVALLAAVELGGAFGSASATVESIDDASMVVTLEVEVTVSAQAVVAHLTFAEEPSRPLSLLSRGAGVFGIRTELEPKNYIVVFEVIGEESELSEPKTLSALGADLVADREVGDPDPRHPGCGKSVGDRREATRGMPAHGAILRQPDAAKLAEPLGDLNLRGRELIDIGASIRVQHLVLAP